MKGECTLNWVEILEAAVVAGVLSSFTDWYFFGILFHDRYHTHPGVWRKYRDKKDEMRSIAWGTLLGAGSCLIFIVICDWPGVRSVGNALMLATAVWALGPLTLMVTNSIFMNLDRALLFSHSVGWLARLAIAALAAGMIL